jgi:hypothetical protein
MERMKIGKINFFILEMFKKREEGKRNRRKRSLPGWTSQNAL